MSATSSYRGRFAPSPTGPLHFGSLVAALASYLDARAHRGEWLVRVEDVDRPREVPGATLAILRTLERFNLYWDGDILYQNRREPVYAEVLEQLRQQGQAFHCACSRSEIAAQAASGPEGPIYPGTCREGLPPGKSGRAWRVQAPDRLITFEDRRLGPQSQNLAREVGDFVIRRADGLSAYQLAVVVDDADQDITDVVRGSDLLLSTQRQMHLQTLLGYPTPRYLHLPVAVNEHIEKLSKQTHAPGITDARPEPLLIAALTFLDQPLPESPQDATAGELLDWAIRHWDIERMTMNPAKPAPQVGLMPLE